MPAPEEEKQEDDGQADTDPGGNVNRQVQADLGLADKGRADRRMTRNSQDSSN